MKHKAILIINVPELESGTRLPYDSTIGVTLPMAAVCAASMVVLKTPTHFRCIKNRHAQYSFANDEKIPNFMFKEFMLAHARCFTVEELIDAVL